MIGDKLAINEGHRKAAQQILARIMPEITRGEDRFILAIAGESGSGKSEIAVVMTERLRKTQIPPVILQQDDYFFYPPRTNAEMRRQDIGCVGPGEVNLELLDEHLKEVLDGKRQIEKPLVIYDEDRISEETLDLRGVKVVIVDGTYTTLLKNVHTRVFLDRTYRNTRKDRRERAREPQDEYLERILRLEHEIISRHQLEQIWL